MVVIFIAGIPTEAAVWSEIDLAADNRFDTCLPGGKVELDSAIHNPVVGYSQAAHTQFPGSLHQLLDAAHAVKQAILSMDVEVAEHGFDLL